MLCCRSLHDLAPRFEHMPGKPERSAAADRFEAEALAKATAHWKIPWSCSRLCFSLQDSRQDLRSSVAKATDPKLLMLFQKMVVLL